MVVPPDERRKKPGPDPCECMDAEGHVIWNAMAPRLWKRFWTYLPREVAKVLGMSKAAFDRVAVLRFAKVAEFQKRGPSISTPSSGSMVGPRRVSSLPRRRK